VTRRPSAARVVAIGVGATAVMDLGGEALRRTTGAAPLDVRLLGRWLGHLRHGRLRHPDILAAEPVAGERELGWAAHYAIGVTFAATLAAARPNWPTRPTLAPALATGLATTAAPWVVMQPAFGLGIAASRTPDPALARLRSLRAHAIYGLGLYLAARVTAPRR
jgi:hypothetical protein